MIFGKKHHHMHHHHLAGIHEGHLLNAMHYSRMKAHRMTHHPRHTHKHILGY